MSSTTQRSTLTVALIGNPNTGKSTLFTALAGVRQRVGNYPGVTVEKKIGSLKLGGRDCQLVDLPGTYSLAPRSPDEMVAVDVLLGRRDDVERVGAVLSILDASNLERNLYLLSQVLELGLPTVVALNMVDIARTKGLTIDVERLRERLGVPVIEVRANRRIGVAELKAALVTVATRASRRPAKAHFRRNFSAKWPMQNRCPPAAIRQSRRRLAAAALPGRALAAGYERLSAKHAAGQRSNVGDGGRPNWKPPGSTGRRRVPGAGRRSPGPIWLGRARAPRCRRASGRADRHRQRSGR